MSKSLNRTVTHAQLNQGLFLQGVGDLGKTFPSPNKTLEDLKMISSELGLVVSGFRSGKKFEALVPWSNIVHTTLIPGEADQKAAGTAVASVKKNSTANKTE